METKENGGSIDVDWSEGEERGGEGEVGGGEGEACYVALKERGIGGQEAGKGQMHNERNVNRDAREMMLQNGVRGEHSGMNGFAGSFAREEAKMFGEGGEVGVSCPAVHGGRVSAEMRQPPAGESEGETPDSDDATLGEQLSEQPSEQPSELGMHQQNCACTQDANMQNGGACSDVKVANGGLHIGTNARATYDWSDSDWSPEINPSMHFDLGERQENGTGSGFRPRSQSDHGGRLVSQCPGEDATDPPHFLHPSKDSPTQGSSAKPPSSCPSEPHIKEDLGDPTLPVRPQTLRTNSNMVLSLSCDATPLSPDEDEDEGGFYFGDEGYEEDFRGVLEAGRRQSAPDNLQDLTQQTDGSDPKLMPKRFGIADFFTRSLFSRKSKEPKALSHNATGWRLFGKTPVREDPPTDPDPTLSTEQCPEEEQEGDPDLSSGPQLPSAAGRRKNLEFEPLSTTALILEDRPANLPAKSLEETQRHKMEYDEMVAGAKRREMKEAQRKKRQMKERHRQEDSISNAMVVWNNEILPHWDNVKGTRRVRDLWWQGLPPSVRGRVWSLAIGNELNITPELYEIFLSRAKEKWRSYSETSSVNDSESDGGASLADRESSLDLIKLDISRTFPSLFIFQKGGPYHDLLHSVLGAYTCYRPDIGYVQGMSFIAAVLILNLEEAEAFITFANLLNKPCQMAFFRVDHELMLKYFAAFEVFFEENLPRLFNHFQTNSLTPDLYLIDWIFTLYSKSLPLDVACRVWDVFCRDGEESLFRTGLGILRLFEDVLLQMDFIHIAQFLTRLPEDMPAHTLFTAMANTHMISRNRRWAQVFSAMMKDVNKEMDKNSSPALRS
ncbi:TBC1 domain family member 12-like [Anoplopoma fimbria]|uniref:TBC1 domain family member 12-like n=1 Tax=Anoplopoma fimbria TaxID=229290 RepID=UPI0023EC75C5|nr:TBC1 domain family member 12-like [Anoplopoma fimbria]